MHSDNKTSFTVKFRKSASLNYLIFIQNMYINCYRGQILKNVRRLKFPYLNTTSWGILDHETFCQRFKETWNNVLDFLSTDDDLNVDGIMLSEKRSQIFGRVFTDNADGNKALEESYLSFLSWWENDEISKIDSSYKKVEQLIHNEILSLTSHNPPAGNLVFEIAFDDFPLVEEMSVRKFFVISRPIEISFLLSSDRITKSLLDKINLAVFE